MKKIIILSLSSVLVSQSGVWLICELVARSVALKTERHLMIEPHFTSVVLGARTLLWLSCLVWLGTTCLLWKRLTRSLEATVTFVGAVVLFCIFISIVATVACILPWLPHN